MSVLKLRLSKVTKLLLLGIILLSWAKEGIPQPVVNLQFNVDSVLPSSEGFNYVTIGHSGTSGAPESAVYTMSGGFLHMDTAALGPNMGAAYYVYEDSEVFDPTNGRTS